MKRRAVWVVFSLILLPMACFAIKGHTLGDVASGINDPVMAVIKLVHVVCMIAGVGLIVGSLIRYKQHRQNPVEVPMSSVIMLLIIGIALIALTFIPVGIKK